MTDNKNDNIPAVTAERDPRDALYVPRFAARRAHPRITPPSFGMDLVQPLLDDAVDFLREATVRQQVGEMRDGRAKGLHPWIKALEWHLRVRGSTLILPAPPEALVVARDMHTLKLIDDVWKSDALRAEARRRLFKEGDPAIWEMRATGVYRFGGIQSEWTALVTATGPDVLVPEFDVEIQVKTRKEGPAAAKVERLLEVVEAAAGQLRGDRPGMILLVVPEVTDWTSWGLVTEPTSFNQRLLGKLADPKFRAVAGVVMAGAAVPTGSVGVTSLSNTAWFIESPTTAFPLPDQFPIFTA